MGRGAAYVVAFTYDLSIWPGTNATRRSSFPIQCDLSSPRLPTSLILFCLFLEPIRWVRVCVVRAFLWRTHSLFHSTMHDTLMILIRTHTARRALLLSTLLLSRGQKRRTKQKQPIYIHAYAGVNLTIIIQCMPFHHHHIQWGMRHDPATSVHLVLNAAASPM